MVQEVKQVHAVQGNAQKGAVKKTFSNRKDLKEHQFYDGKTTKSLKACPFLHNVKSIVIKKIFVHVLNKNHKIMTVKSKAYFLIL